MDQSILPFAFNHDDDDRKKKIVTAHHHHEQQQQHQQQQHHPIHEEPHNHHDLQQQRNEQKYIQYHPRQNVCHPQQQHPQPPYYPQKLLHDERQEDEEQQIESYHQTHPQNEQQLPQQQQRSHAHWNNGPSSVSPSVTNAIQDHYVPQQQLTDTSYYEQQQEQPILFDGLQNSYFRYNQQLSPQQSQQQSQQQLQSQGQRQGQQQGIFLQHGMQHQQHMQPEFSYQSHEQQQLMMRTQQQNHAWNSTLPQRSKKETVEVDALLDNTTPPTSFTNTIQHEDDEDTFVTICEAEGIESSEPGLAGEEAFDYNNDLDPNQNNTSFLTSSFLSSWRRKPPAVISTNNNNQSSNVVEHKNNNTSTNSGATAGASSAAGFLLNNMTSKGLALLSPITTKASLSAQHNTIQKQEQNTRQRQKDSAVVNQNQTKNKPTFANEGCSDTNPVSEGRDTTNNKFTSVASPQYCVPPSPQVAVVDLLSLLIDNDNISNTNSSSSNTQNVKNINNTALLHQHVQKALICAANADSLLSSNYSKNNNGGNDNKNSVTVTPKESVQNALIAKMECSQHYLRASTLIKKYDSGLSRSFLILSNSQARAACSLKEVIQKYDNGDKTSHLNLKKLQRQGLGSASITQNSSDVFVQNTQGNTATAASSKTNIAFLSKLLPNMTASLNKSSAIQHIEENIKASTCPETPSSAKVNNKNSSSLAYTTHLDDIANKDTITTAADTDNSTYDSNDSKNKAHNDISSSAVTKSNNSNCNKTKNPIDDLMKLERELKSMDMELTLGASVASLNTKLTTGVTSNNSIYGSFCLIPGAASNSNGLASSYVSSSSSHVTATSSSYMSNSILFGREGPSSPQHHHQRHATIPTNNNGGRPPKLAIGSNVSTIMGSSSIISVASKGSSGSACSSSGSGSGSSNSGEHSHNYLTNNQSNPLELSWWGSNSIYGSSSVVMNKHQQTQQTVSSKTTPPSNSSNSHNHQTAETSTANKNDNNSYSNHDQQQHQGRFQIMRLLDTLKTLSDENASLMKEVENASKSRLEAKAAREDMKRFKLEYGNKFATVKNALETFRRDHLENRIKGKGANGGGSGKVKTHNINIPDEGNGENDDPVWRSQYIQTKLVQDFEKKQYQLTRSLQKTTVALQNEREESRKKNVALKKYENFYREVKLRSAQRIKEKAAAAAAAKQQQECKKNVHGHGGSGGVPPKHP